MPPKNVREYIAKLEEELDRYKNGYQGGCYACEPVGEQNQRLREAIKAFLDTDPYYSCTSDALNALEAALAGEGE